MPSNILSVRIRDLDAGPVELNQSLPKDWLNSLLSETEVQQAPETEAKVSLVLTKTGSEVLIQGHLDVTISTPCARTLEPALYSLRPKVFLMLSPGPGVTASEAHQSGASGRKRKKSRTDSKKGAWSEAEELSPHEAALDTYDGDEIHLAEFIREFILLEVPMVPLQEDLRDVPFEANPPLPDARSLSGGLSGETDEPSIDPRLSPLRELKARLENKE